MTMAARFLIRDTFLLNYHVLPSRSNICYCRLFNPFSPHDALKHHFTSLKTDLILLQPRVLERKSP